ncbi:DnaJ family domain-containing protein [Desmospora profundinema]|uniref:DnaJ homologue subfamily C member 28 conserved domain-containing protein n=1 Tax=Desmospora profundinema TaxID=1571184 RepID=A0ABU1INB5_9BACL|nr:DUF1992 domain-containing protein [Desmospora profundinema]MDR6226272.1 hypothetical protein [Desmospora profundinema]
MIPITRRKNDRENTFPPAGHGDWLDQIVKEHEQKGGFDHLSGKGKPLSKKTLEEEAFHHILKNAHYLPPWLELRHQIKNQIQELLSNLDKKAAPEKRDREQVEEVNRMIQKYNQLCPHPSMQRGLVTIDNLNQAVHQWE